MPIYPPYVKVRKYHLRKATLTSATITSKGQITIPSAVRQSMQVESGDRVEFVEISPSQFMIVPANRSVTELKGMFGKAKRTVSIAEMNRAIAARGASAK